MNVLKFLMTKWITGDCRHFCLFCQYKDTCLDFLTPHSKYKKGYNDGYDCGYNDAFNNFFNKRWLDTK